MLDPETQGEQGTGLNPNEGGVFEGRFEFVPDLGREDPFKDPALLFPDLADSFDDDFKD